MISSDSCNALYINDGSPPRDADSFSIDAFQLFPQMDWFGFLYQQMHRKRPVSFHDVCVRQAQLSMVAEADTSNIIFSASFLKHSEPAQSCDKYESSLMSTTPRPWLLNRLLLLIIIIK